MLERLTRVQRLCNGFLFRAPIYTPEYTSKWRLAACSCPLVETNFVVIREKSGGSVRVRHAIVTTRSRAS